MRPLQSSYFKSNNYPNFATRDLANLRSPYEGSACLLDTFLIQTCIVAAGWTRYNIWCCLLLSNNYNS
jgi:hypothetical protein